MNKVGFLSVLSLTTIVIGEVSARVLLGLGSPPLTVEHPTIEYLFKPNQNVLRFGNRIIINEYGMRTREFPAERTDIDELRIMVFGDSVLNGGNLTDHDNLATTIVESYLQKDGEVNAIIGNISAGSWGPGNWLAYAEEFGFFEADVVILLLSSHDYADIPSFRPLNPNTHPTQAPISALVEGIQRYIPRYLPALWSNKGEDTEFDDNSSSDLARQEAALQGLSDLQDFLLLARDNIEQVYVFLHLEKGELEGEKNEGYYKIEELVNSLGIDLISLEESYKRVISGEKDIYRDNIHINDYGQRTLAEIFIEKLIDVNSLNTTN